MKLLNGIVGFFGWYHEKRYILWAVIMLVVIIALGSYTIISIGPSDQHAWVKAKCSSGETYMGPKRKWQYDVTAIYEVDQKTYKKVVEVRENKESLPRGMLIRYNKNNPQDAIAVRYSSLITAAGVLLICFILLIQYSAKAVRELKKNKINLEA